MSSFQSPPPETTQSTRKRSVFALGSVSGKKPYTLGSKKKPPPSGGRSRLSLFKSPMPSFYNKTKTTATANNETDRRSSSSTFQSRSLFSDTESTTCAETGEDISSSDFNANNNVFRDNNSNSNSNTMDLNPVQSEVGELRQKLQDLGSHNRRSELLLGQMKVLEEESQRKDDKLRFLNDKLHGIQRGLSQIDDERSLLQQQVQQLEEEKGKTQRQLDLREQEVLTLVKRCSTQEDKMRESILLRVKNEELTKEIEELRAAMAQQETERTSLEETARELEECQQKLEHSKRDHDALADTLHNCLASIKKLTHEKLEWEDERRRLLNRAEVEIEKERLQHVGDMNELKVQLQHRQDKIDKLEEFMRDKSMTNLMLRKENAELNKWKNQTGVKLEEHERQIAELSEENKEKLQEIEELSRGQCDWTSKLQEKDNTIATLEQDISQFMTRSMSTSEELEVLQEENIELEEIVEKLQEKVKTFDTWEEERDAMLEYLAVTQSQIQELMEEVVTLQLENDDLEEEKQELLDGAKSSDTYSSDDEVKRLEKDFSEKESNWKELEQNLRNKIASMESGKSVVQEGLEAKLETAQDTIRKLEWTVASMELRKELEESREGGADKVDEIISLESDLTDSKRQFEKCNAERLDLQNQAIELRTEIDDAHKELKESMATIRNLETRFADQGAELFSTRDAFVHIAEEDAANFQYEKTTLQRQLKESQDLIQELESKLSAAHIAHQKEIDDLEDVLSIKEDELMRSCQALEGKDSKIALLRDSLEATKSSQQQDVSQLHALLSQQQDETSALGAELQKAKTDLVLKDDEIRELRMIELKDYEEEISDLRQEVGSKEADINGLMEKLQVLSLQQLEREHTVAEEVNNLKNTIAQLKQEKHRVEDASHLSGEDEQKLQANAVTLQRKNQLLEQSIASLRMEMGLVVASESSNKEQTKKLEMALQREISLKEATNKDLLSSLKQVECLEMIVSELKAEKDRVEMVLQERSDLLGQMVEINKSLQSAADTLSDTKHELTELRRERGELTEAVSREQSLREVLEAELSTVHAQVASIKKEGKDNASLKTENAELHAKIKRQEAFLKKKLQKEKVMRDRSSSANTMSTPGRLGSARKLRSTVKKTRQPNLDHSFSENWDPNLSIMSESDF